MPQQSQLLLIGESFSPWTKKARWALEYCGLIYDYKEYTPTLSEPGLRWRLRQWSGSVSVPVLFADREIFRGSWDIARYANEAAGDARLGDMELIASWNEVSESGLSEGRTNVVRCILGNKQALKEALPDFVPEKLRHLLSFVARNAVQRLDQKYAHLVKPGSLRQALGKTREALKNSDNDYLLDHFSYADISMAVLLEVIAPIVETQPPLGPATQACWKNETLSDEFVDLVDWRNRLASNAKTSYSQFKINKE